PGSVLMSQPVKETILANPSLFHIVTLIRIDRFESLLSGHPNCALVKSVCEGLREGLWPFATISPNDPLTNDSAHCELDESGAAFVWAQRDLEIAEGRYSKAFRMDLLPGMHSPPIHVVPKPHSDKFCLINDHSAELHSLNLWISKTDAPPR
ncbi:hypothetical protein K439DRAFT_1374310, partial [Ramaria rubella]